MKHMLIGLALIVPIVSCSLSENPIQDRAKKARKAGGDIIIGAAAPWDACQQLWQGIEMAVDEINAGGGILGRKIQVIQADDKASVSEGQIVAQEFAENMDMVAVIGHYNSYVSNRLSILYEYYGLLMMTPLSTSPKLTSQGFKRIFRSVPDDEMFGTELALFCQRQGYRQMAIYQRKDDYGEGLANAFEKQCTDSGIAIADRLAYDFFSGERHFEEDLAYWLDNFSFDAIFLAGIVPEAAVFIEKARKMGITVPIIGGDGLDSPQLIEIAGQAAEGTFVGSVFHPDDPRGEVQAFVRTYRNRYGAEPDVQAAQGYDAIKVLAQAMTNAESTVPDKMADALRATKNFTGVTGLYSFDEKGNLTGRTISVKIVRNGRFELLPN